MKRTSEYKSTILKGNYAKFNAYFLSANKLQIEYRKCNKNFRKIIEDIECLEKRIRPTKYEPSTFPQNQWFKVLMKILPFLRYAF